MGIKKDEFFEENIVSAEDVTYHLTSVMRGEKQMATISNKDGEYDCEMYPKISERLKAAELLGKMFNIFSANRVLNIEPIIIRGEDELEE